MSNREVYFTSTIKTGLTQKECLEKVKKSALKLGHSIEEITKKKDGSIIVVLNPKEEIWINHKYQTFV